jgi:phosphonate transport system substrate-binding protein
MNLSEFGISRVKIKVAKNLEQMQAYINNGEVDILSETLLTAVALNNVDVEMLRWKKGVDRYKTLLITHVDSSIYSIKDLIGNAIALEDEGSTSGYFIPMLEMATVTKKIVKKDNVQQTNHPAKINYIFSTKAYATSIDNLTIWVHRSIVDAAAVSNVDWDNEKKFPAKIKQDLRVFHRTADFPRSLTMYRSNLNEKLKQAITEALLDADDDIQGKNALENFVHTKKFTLLTEEEKKSIAYMRENYKQRIILVE